CRMRKRQGFQKNTIDRAENRSCGTDAESECDYSHTSEPRRFAKLAQGELEIVHVIQRAVLESDRRVWRAGPEADMRSTQSLPAKWSRQQAVPDYAPKPHTIATQSSARARMLRRSRS